MRSKIIDWPAWRLPEGFASGAVDCADHVNKTRRRNGGGCRHGCRRCRELFDENSEFRALYRYVNRESHADAVILTNFGEIDPTQCVARSRDVFVKTEFEEHFGKMKG